jgi:hypothetical protein
MIGLLFLMDTANRVPNLRNYAMTDEKYKQPQNSESFHQDLNADSPEWGSHGLTRIIGMTHIQKKLTLESHESN